MKAQLCATRSKMFTVTLTLFRPGGGGGGGILPAATLDVNNFFDIKANVTKATFSKIYLATNWYDMSLST